MELGSENQNDYFVIQKNIKATPLITRRNDGPRTIEYRVTLCRGQTTY